MARKNKNAGQLNRQAQMVRHARRRKYDDEYRRSQSMVLGPLSENLTRPPRKTGELVERVGVMV